MRWLAFILIALPVLGDDVYPIARRGGLANNNWNGAGIRGGIPAVSTVYTTLTSTATAANINTAINNCPSNQVVYCQGGYYNINGIIELTNHGVVLRGETNANGMWNTVFTNCRVRINSYYQIGAGVPDFDAGGKTSISSGYTEGSTSVTLVSAPNSEIRVGQLAIIAQSDDSADVYPDTNEGTYTPTGYAYSYTVLVTNISGSTVQFDPPLLGTYWSAGDSPVMYGWSVTRGKTTHKAGLEDLDINMGNQTGDFHTLRWIGGYECWIKNVRIDDRSNGGTAAGSAMMYSSRIEFREMQLHDVAAGSSSGVYSMLVALVSYPRIEDNIFTNMSLAIVMNTIVGGYVGHNYVSGPYPYGAEPNSFLAECIFFHGGHNHHTLLEGNWTDGPVYVDSIFSNNDSDLGLVRNRIVGFYQSKNAEGCLAMCDGNDPHVKPGRKKNVTAVGNVLGSAGKFSIVYDSNINANNAVFHGDTSEIAFYKTNNWNSVTAGIPSDEAIGSNTMQDSYGRSNTNRFGFLSFPPFSPTSTDTNILRYTNIPAGFRSYNGYWPAAAAAGGSSSQSIAGGSSRFGGTARAGTQ